MPIYKVETEGDCEGKTTKLLGYVEATSAEHAAMHMKHIGKDSYYQYWVTCEYDLVVKAAPLKDLDYLVPVRSQSYSSEWCGTVKTNETVMQERRQIVEAALKNSGLTVEDVIKYGKPQ